MNPQRLLKSSNTIKMRVACTEATFPGGFPVSAAQQGDAQVPKIATVPKSLGGRSTGEATIFQVLNVPVAQMSMKHAVETVNSWTVETTGIRSVVFVSVHIVVEAYRDPEFRAILLQMDLGCADGAPIYWLAKAAGSSGVERIAGPDFMPAFCEFSSTRGVKHFVYGGPVGVAERAALQMKRRYPGILIAGHFSPPFYSLSANELDEVAAMIQASGADVVWVCLGCPKQERWIHEMRGRLNGKVLLAVGQAVDIMAGRTNRAPRLVTNLGLEWAYRLVQEPRRLWKRYLVTNSLFVRLIVREHFFPGSAARHLTRTQASRTRKG